MKANLAEALRLPTLPRLAVVGGGGKTTALFQMGRAMRGAAWITTSTHLGIDQLGMADRHMMLEESTPLKVLEATRTGGLTVISGPSVDGQRVSGLSEKRLFSLRELADEWQIPLFVEADGSRGLPLKAPAAYEPAIPAWAEQVVVMVGLSGLGQILGPEWVHRVELFSTLSGIQPGETVSPEGLARVLADPMGGLKNIPTSALRSLVFNQADRFQDEQQIHRLTDLLVSVYDDIVVAALRKHVLDQERTQEPAVSDWSDPQAAQIDWVQSKVGGVVLAAGASKRLGRAKQLLEWRGEPLVRHVARAGLQAGLDPLVVVTGVEREAVERAVSGLKVTCVENPEWAMGQSRSMQVGLGALPARTRAAVFLLSDQPQVPAALVQALVEKHAKSLAPVVAPWVGGRRGNPVLFDRITFIDLLQIQGDMGGRAIFEKYLQEKVLWPDDSIFLDVDTDADYERLLGLVDEPKLKGAGQGS